MALQGRLVKYAYTCTRMYTNTKQYMHTYVHATYTHAAHTYKNFFNKEANF